MGATSSKGKNAKTQSKTTTTGSDVHRNLTSTCRVSPNCKSDDGKERRPSLTRESSSPTRPTVTSSSSKAADGTTRHRRASIQPRTSTIMEEPPAIETTTKTKATSGSRSIFMCCAASAV